MKLIDNLASTPKMYVVQVLAIIGVVNLIWSQLPPDTVAALPAGLVYYVNVGLSILATAVRVIKQFDTDDEPQS